MLAQGRQPALAGHAGGADRHAADGRPAIIEYFKPLQDWLREQNKGKTCGW